MNKELIFKFIGGAITAGGAATFAFLSVQGCTVNKEVLTGLAIAFAGGVFHYAKNYKDLSK